ncbi:MAG: hypothetical protein L0Y54_10720 [Sporichthyaceae bacterium]|nr:hypothetical protein [Sporichthyaceae bacterium]
MPHYTTAQAAQRLGLPREQVEDAIVQILLNHPDRPGIDGVIFYSGEYSGERDMSRVRITERALQHVRTLTGQAAAS